MYDCSFQNFKKLSSDDQDKISSKNISKSISMLVVTGQDCFDFYVNPG